MPHKFFFDRTQGELYGYVTLQHVDSNGKVIKVFERMPAASGQRGFLNKPNDWTRGKGACPFGNHWLTTKAVPLQMEPKGTPFYGIGTNKGSTIIYGPNGKHREAIGLHWENRYPGSAGCVVLLQDTALDECRTHALAAYLKQLSKYEPYVEFIVL